MREISNCIGLQISTCAMCVDKSRVHAGEVANIFRTIHAIDWGFRWKRDLQRTLCRRLCLAFLGHSHLYWFGLCNALESPKGVDRNLYVRPILTNSVPRNEELDRELLRSFRVCFDAASAKLRSIPTVVKEVLAVVLCLLHQL